MHRTKRLLVHAANVRWRCFSKQHISRAVALQTQIMVLYFVGLGLGDAKDITVRGLEVVRAAERVYLEAYTSILTCGQAELEKFYGREVILADRDMVEQKADEILEGSDTNDVAFLVVGDPFGATTHSDLVLRAKERGIVTKTIHNASIMNAVGCVGLQLYRFGETVSIPFWSDDWKPDSFYDKIGANIKHGLHTLCLLDIKVKERSIENLIKGRDIFEPPRFMTCAQAANQLIEIITTRQAQTDENKSIDLKADHKVIGVARVGSDQQRITVCSLSEMQETDMGPPLHSLIITGDVHLTESEAISIFSK